MNILLSLIVGSIGICFLYPDWKVTVGIVLMIVSHELWNKKELK